MDCQICRRRTKLDATLCSWHLFALKQLLRKHETWQKAAGVEWDEYLKRLDANPLTGIWVREVISWADATRKDEGELRGFVKLSKSAPQDP